MYTVPPPSLLYQTAALANLPIQCILHHITQVAWQPGWCCFQWLPSHGHLQMRVLWLRWTLWLTQSVLRCRLQGESLIQVSPMAPLLPLGISSWHCPRLSFLPSFPSETILSTIWRLQPLASPIFRWPAIHVQCFETLHWYLWAACQLCCLLSMLHALHCKIEFRSLFFMEVFSLLWKDYCTYLYRIKKSFCSCILYFNCWF